MDQSELLDQPKCEAGCGQDAKLQSAECALCEDCFGDLMRETLEPVLGRKICGTPIKQNEWVICLAPYGEIHNHQERQVLNELVYELGKVAFEMGEDWRLKHAALMDAFEFAQEVLETK